MILDKLVLENFCLFGGRQVIELAPSSTNGRPAPITLIGGVNGGGKTTLLDAIQLVLYGNRARCSKRNDKPYEEFIRESIHHGVSLQDGAAIELSFRYVAEGKENLYEVSRAWADQRGKLREQVRVTKDGLFDSWMSDNWSQLVEELIPIGIAQLCFFDAEKIRFLAEDETSTRALGEAIKSLLGLDLAERLIADATVLERRIAKRVRSSPQLQEIESLDEAFEKKQAEVERLVQELGSLENPRQMAYIRLNTAEEEFASVGGEHWQRRQDTTRRRIELEREVNESEAELVSLAGTAIPLHLVPELLQSIAEQCECERSAIERKAVSRLLAKRDQELVAHLKCQGASTKTLQLLNEFLEKDLKERSVDDAVDLRLQLSDGGRRMLEHLMGDGLNMKHTAAREQLERLRSARLDLEHVQRTLASTPQEDAVRQVAEELKAATTELALLDHQIARSQKQLTAARSERETLEKKLNTLQRQLIDEELKSEENLRLADLLSRTKQTMTTYLQRATMRKIDRLSTLITESFRFLLRKQSLVQHVNIEPETFTITLHDDSGRAVPKERLSEGEKQIFAVSVLWGLSRAAGRPLPTIVDTPMARLDAKHRENLVERYFPNASHQVIVLSTDTEVEHRSFQSLQPHISRAYRLNYDEQQKQTVAEEGYFWTADDSRPANGAHT